MFDMSKSEVRRNINYNSIVKVDRFCLIQEGNRYFVEQYLKYGYGHCFNEILQCYEKDGFLSVILPGVINTLDNPWSKFRYVNYFPKDKCSISYVSKNIDLESIPLNNRLNNFFQYVKL